MSKKLVVEVGYFVPDGNKVKCVSYEELLAQPEPIEDKFDRVKSNREFYQAGYAEAERKLKPEQEQVPVAWITEWVQRYRNNDTPIMDRAVSFTKGGAPAVPNPNYIPLYLAPPKREPLSDDEVVQLINTKHFDTSYTLQQSDKVNLKWYKQGVKDAETHHKIGVDNV